MKKLALSIIMINFIMAITTITFLVVRVVKLTGELDNKQEQINEMLTIKQSMQVYQHGYKTGSMRLCGKDYHDTFYDSIKFRADSLMMVRDIKKALQ